jgi:hypothetical protein
VTYLPQHTQNKIIQLFLSLSLSSAGDDHREIQRQNKITQQILTNFLERRLFPYRRPQQKVPSVDEILQSATDPPPRDREQQDDDEDKVTRDEGDIDSDIESLQSVESEQIDSFYRDEGRSLVGFHITKKIKTGKFKIWLTGGGYGFRVCVCVCVCVFAIFGGGCKNLVHSVVFLVSATNNASILLPTNSFLFVSY